MKNDNTPSLEEQEAPMDRSESSRREETKKDMLDQKVAPSQTEKHSILRARARILARKPAQEVTANDLIVVIEFRLGSETYAIESAFVRKVYQLKDYTPLPGTPNFVLGIINVRGQIFSVVDLSRFFNIPRRGLGELNKVIIIRNEEMEFGILADTVLGTRQISLKAIQALPPTVTGIGAEYLKGVTAERVIVIDAKKILGDEKVMVDEESEKP
ncbi:MAG: chemotaxis protein CheW [Methanomassiliicoccales archaeon]|nr:chemotaxis protein CheW [Methanomassiliicoccales archaeon]